MTLLLLAGLLCGLSLRAQESKGGRSMFSAHIGPAWYTGDLPGLTRNTDAYRSELRQGLGWDFSYWYPGSAPYSRALKVGPGLVYRGNTARHAWQEGSDEVWMHTLSLQLGLFLVRNRFQVQLAAGPGVTFYRDHSTVYGKPREVSAQGVALDVALAGEYFLHRHWGVSARLGWTLTPVGRYSVGYHDETTTVDLPSGTGGTLGALALLFGINYHF